MSEIRVLEVKIASRFWRFLDFTCPGFGHPPNTVNVRKPNVRFSALLKVVWLLNRSDFERRSITELNRSVIGHSVGYSF